MNCCIIWPGYIDRDGYGQVNSNKDGTLRTARIVLEQKLNRKIRDGHQAHHICYFRICINPYHIEERSFRDNINDKYFPDRPMNDRILLTKKDVYLVFYLLRQGVDINEISCFIKVKIYSSINEVLRIDIPIEVIILIKNWNVWNYVHLYNWEKVEALHTLQYFFPEGKCIEADWGGKANNYPVVQKANKIIPAHVFSYRLHNKRPIPEGQIVRHIICDNVRCIRPQHLAIGSQLANIDDKIRKGRNHREKLLDGMEKEILRLIDDEGMSFRAVGIYLSQKVNRKKPFDHKLIINRYKNYKLALGEKLSDKGLTQREILSSNREKIRQLREVSGYSFRKISFVLGADLLPEGKPFDQKLVKEVYLELKRHLNEAIPPTINELLIQKKDIIKSLVKEKRSFRSIAKQLTKELNLTSPLHHKQIKKYITQTSHTQMDNNP